MRDRKARGRRDLTLLRRKSLSYRIQSIDLLYISVDWFLNDRDLCDDRVKVKGKAKNEIQKTKKKTKTKDKTLESA